MNREEKISVLTSKKTKFENKINELGNAEPQKIALLNKKITELQERLEKLGDLS